MNKLNILKMYMTLKMKFVEINYKYIVNILLWIISLILSKIINYEILLNKNNNDNKVKILNKKNI